MFDRLNKARPLLADLERVEAMFRARFRLAEDCLLLVNEDAGRVSGEPERMTTVSFWVAGVRHRVRVFKSVAKVVEDDLPPYWVMGALKDDGEADCC